MGFCARHQKKGKKFSDDSNNDDDNYNDHGDEDVIIILVGNVSLLSLAPWAKTVLPATKAFSVVPGSSSTYLTHIRANLDHLWIPVNLSVLPNLAFAVFPE